MATGSSLLGNGNDAVLRARDGATDEKQIPIGVDLDHPEAELGVPLGAHMTGHPLSFDDAGWVGSGADRAWLSVPSISVRCRPAAKAMAVYHSLESATLRGAGNLYQLTRRE